MWWEEGQRGGGRESLWWERGGSEMGEGGAFDGEREEPVGAAGRKEGEVAAHAWRGGSKVGKKSEPLVAASREVGEGGSLSLWWERGGSEMGEGAGSGGRGGRQWGPPAAKRAKGQ
uniref:Uncharacterized protein n=1 Tax=Heterosigma akashiwo TaxID=2829 RepID=A0A7S3Y1W2_HETAK